MRNITSALLFVAILILACAGNKAEIERHRTIARQAYDSSNFRSATAHIDSAASLCSNLECRTSAYYWLLNVSKTFGNDVLRAQSYKNLVLTYLDYSIKSDSPEEYSDSAYATANRYLQWSDSLHAYRGDPFPLADALLLTAETVPPDSPGVAIAYLMRLTSRPDTVEVPPNLQPYTSRAEKLLDEFGAEMTNRYRNANQIFADSPAKAIKDYKYVYSASAGFGNAELASEIALKLAEYYRDNGEKALASKWAGEALLWESRKDREDD